MKLLAGDCRDVLPTLAADSVHCVVCSPPYYGLRDYGTALWDGGDAACDHRHETEHQKQGRTSQRLGASNAEAQRNETFRDTCGKCGAVRIDRQIGLEATPDEYLATMVAVFREVRRVLRPDGTCWVNMGDSYASHGGYGTGGNAGRTGCSHQQRNTKANSHYDAGLKPKDLLLMPARLALALQADGWWVRSAIVWAKPNPMPESCLDRPTSAYEMVYLLTKRATYFYDADAVREPHTEGTHSRGGDKTNGRDALIKSGHWNTLPPTENPAGRSCRNVWTIATSPFSAAHFATYPPELAERCIRAGTSERGCCAACGAPWRRITDKAFVPQPDVSLARGVRLETQHDGANQWPGTPRGTTSATTTGWAPGCKCQANYDCSGLGCGHQPCICIGLRPCTVLDPFAGAGTTLLVADRLQRDAIGIELNVDYTRMAMDRCIADAPLFTSFTPAEDPNDARTADLFAGDAA